MSNAPKELPDSKPMKVLTEDQVKQLLMKSMPDADPDLLLRNLTKQLAKHSADKTDDAVSDPAMHKTFNMALSSLSLDTHARLADTTTDKLAPLAVAFTKQLIQDYQCQTAAEKTLAEVVAAAYVRVLRYSEALNNVYAQGTTTTELNKYMAVTSTELDRANRHYLTALSMLKSFKQPAVNVTFKANNAFVAQNQEINATPPNGNGLETNQ